jgi:hypothetical protein
MERPIIMLNTDNMPVFCRNQCANTKCAKHITKAYVCKSCEYYESCGKPERYIKCMGYKERQQAAGEHAVDVQDG